MRYKKKRVIPPIGLEVGAEVGIIGEGADTQTVTAIHLSEEDGGIIDVSLSEGWREPLYKLYLVRGRPLEEAYRDRSSWFHVAIGECDVCGVQFPDCCVYYSAPDAPDSMTCQKCHAAGRGADNSKISVRT